MRRRLLLRKGSSEFGGLGWWWWWWWWWCLRNYSYCGGGHDESGSKARSGCASSIGELWELTTVQGWCGEDAKLCALCIVLKMTGALQNKT